jgi:hypothetical protein
MTDNIIDGRSRFQPNAQQKSASRSVLDIMERDSSPRIPPEARVTLASNLGEFAAKIDAENPARVAKRWFDRWDGDRWQKRKKFICFPGEDSRDPAAAGQLAASRGDWRALINAAVYDQFPNEGSAAERDRENLRRTLLRGTKYVPNVDQLSAGDVDAQRLLITFAQKVCDRMADVQGLRRLWDVLQTTPFTIHPIHNDHSENISGYDKPVEIASAAANAVRDLDPSFGREYVVDRLVRFGQVYGRDPETTEAQIAWSLPKIRLGLLGYGVDTRIFVVPENLLTELRVTGLHDIHESDGLADWVASWFDWKGLIQVNETNFHEWTLPEIDYAPETRFGWIKFRYEIVREVWLSCRPKADGKPGLWLSVDTSDDMLERYYPVLPQIDCLAIESSAPPVLLRTIPWFWPDRLGNSPDYTEQYRFLSWPERDPVFTIDLQPKFLPLPGLLEPLDNCQGEWGNVADLPFIGGWLDDASNDELQNILFRLPPGVRFLPSIQIDYNAPPICPHGTIAAALFANLACLREEQVMSYLVHAGERLAKAGLGYHEALMQHYGSLIDQLNGDT